MLQAVKPTSIIFLVIAAVLLIAGMITCTIAKDIAETDGYILFDESMGFSNYAQHDFSDENLTKIELVVKDAEIYIYGGAERSYVEFFNFREDLYTLSSSGQILSFDEIPNIKSLLNFESGFSFGGMRYILRRSNQEDAVRRINIYVASQNASLKVITATGDNCTVYVDKLVNQCDIYVSAEKAVTLHANELLSNCSLTVTSDERADIDLNNSTLHTLTVSADHGEVTAEQLYFAALDLTMNTGSSQISTSVLLDACDILTDSGRGTVRIGGRNIARPTEYVTEEAIAAIRFSSPEASLAVTSIGE